MKITIRGHWEIGLNENQVVSDKGDLSILDLDYDEVKKSFKCSECGEMSFKKSTLTQHKFIHKGMNCFQCEGCGKSFAQEYDVDNNDKNKGKKWF